MKAIYRSVLAQVTEWCPNPSETEAEEAFRGLGGTESELAELRTPEGHAGLEITADLWDSDGVILDHELWVSWMDPALIVDPTDAQVDAARARRPIPADPDLLRAAMEWVRTDPTGPKRAATVLRSRTRPPGDVSTAGRQGDAR